MNLKSTFSKVRKELKAYSKPQNKIRSHYAHCLTKDSVVKNRILFESFHGKNLSDSPWNVLNRLVSTGEVNNYEIFYASNDIDTHKQLIDKLDVSVELVDINSLKYAEVLATSAYIISNATLPSYFIRRDTQNYICTWSNSVIDTEVIYKTQHNYIQANYLTFPDDSIRENIMRVYKLIDLFTGEVAFEDDFIVNLILSRSDHSLKSIDYSSNAERKWIIRDFGNIGNVAGLEQVSKSMTKDSDILVLYAKVFTKEMSAYLNDKYKDSFNYIFVDNDTPISLNEGLNNIFTGNMDKVLYAREMARRFGKLNVTLPKQDFASIDVNMPLINRKLSELYGSASIEDNHVVIRCTSEKFKPYKIFAMNRSKVVIWKRNLTDEECQSGIIREHFNGIFSYELLNGNEWVDLILEGTNQRNEPRLMYVKNPNLPPSNIRKFVDPRFIGTIIHKSEDYSAEIVSASKFLRKSDEYAIVVYYSFGPGRLKLRFQNSTTNYQTVAFAYAKNFQISKTGRVSFSLETNSQYRLLNVYLSHGSPVNPARFLVDCEQLSNNMYHCQLDLTDINLNDTHWRFVAEVEYDNKIVSIAVTNESKFLLKKLKYGNIRFDYNGMSYIPYIVQNGQLRLMYRETSKYETNLLRIKEITAIFIAKFLKPYWKKRNIWLVFEKFCSLAQDNGYYFFEYCMEQKGKKKKNILYVIDKSSSDYKNVAKYDKNVIQYMSFKHILYLMVARVYVGSDSKAHLYVWRSRPSAIVDNMKNKSIYFLQHGVLALKRVDNIFGLYGSSPMTDFTTISDNEKTIVLNNFGYKSANVPVVGLSRWDALNDLQDKSNPTILVMPTWRSWLEDLDSEQFKNSEYFKTYSSLITSTKLQSLLKKYNARLAFYIHPKLCDFMQYFKTDVSNIDLIEQGSEPLNRIIMKSSMLITDYSSVCWDMLYMDKPVLFYHFDQDQYLKDTGSYIDFNTQLPGNLCRTEHELIDSLEDTISNGFSLTNDVLEKLDGWYPYKDKKNRERTYKYIINKYN